MAEDRPPGNPEIPDEPNDETKEQGTEEELPDDPQAEPQADEMTLVREELEEALREKDQFRTMAQRAQADLINFKRRAAQEQEEVRRSATSHLILGVLSIVDDLDRAVALVPEDAVAEGWVDGLKLIQRNVGHLLDSVGVSKMEAQGKPFEPREHEAVAYVETTDGDEGMVESVIREGYMLRDRVLRAAQVVVSKSPERKNDSDDTEEEA